MSGDESGGWISAFTAVAALVVSGVALGVSILSVLLNRSITRQAQKVRITQKVGALLKTLTKMQAHLDRHRTFQSVALKWFDRADVRFDQAQKDQFGLSEARQRLEEMSQVAVEMSSKVDAWFAETTSVDFAKSQAEQDRLELKLESIATGLERGLDWFHDAQESASYIEGQFQMMLRSPPNRRELLQEHGDADMETDPN